MEHLKIILNHLESKCDSFKGTYFIPEVWNSFEYWQYFKEPSREGQISLNPFSFMSACIKECILKEADSSISYNKPLLDQNETDVLNIGKNVIYSIFPRVFTAWDHYEKGKICSGTFLKAICLLPYLKKLKVDIIYLLPVFKYSDKYRKGELGSPYAIKNFYQLDPGLHDQLLDGEPEITVETEFKAFIEACHILKIKVMVDFVFRTVSRDNDLLIEHPDWFYWIYLQNNHNFAPPTVENEKKLTRLSDKSLKNLYTCRGLSEYLSQFTYSPADIDLQKWRQVLTEYYETQTNILDLIENAYQITTAPGFSDVLNDPQPPWTDVTYLKFYQDTNPKSKPYLRSDQPPYILQDIACLNLYQGTVPNQGLWDYCLEVIPYYQDKYGIDGARIDMGHALPPELNREIVARSKAKNEKFIFWSEEFVAENSQAAAKDGFHFISGNLWSVYNEVDRPSFNKKLFQTVTQAVLPLTAALETPDTPRMAWVYRDRQKISLMLLLNCLVANAVPFINNGMELLEIQPMNLGLNNDETGRFVLAKEDPMYGKLAFFDNYCLHWLSREQEWFRSLLVKALEIRNGFAEIINKRANLIKEYWYLKNPKILFFCYYQPNNRRNLFFLANKDFRERARVRAKDLFPEEVRKDRQKVIWIYTGNQATDLKWDLNRSKLLAPGEVLIGYLE